MKILRIHRQDFMEVKALFEKGRRQKREEFAFLLAEKIVNTLGLVVYLVRELIVPSEADMITRSSALVEPSFDFLIKVYNMAAAKGYSIFDIHNHWFQPRARFSYTDTSVGLGNGESIARIVPKADFGLAVFNDKVDQFDGAIYNKSSGSLEDLDAIEVMGSPMEVLFLRERKRAGNTAIDEQHSRHGLIPGWKQELLRDLRVSVIGAGANGAIIIQALACIGIGEGRGEFILVDHDNIEESNLSRIPYAFREDIGKPKVEVAERYIKARNPSAKVRTYHAKVQSPEVCEAVAGSNFIIGAVDSEGARKIVSRIAHEACVPYLDTGAEIIPREDSYHAGGQVRIIMPREGCLICNDGIDLAEAANDLMSDETRKLHRSVGYVRGTSETPTPSVIHLNGVVAYLAVAQFIKVVMGENWKGQRAVYYDERKMRMIAAEFDRDDECALCGEPISKGDSDEQPTETEVQSGQGNRVLSGCRVIDPAVFVPPCRALPSPGESGKTDGRTPEERGGQQRLLDDQVLSDLHDSNGGGEDALRGQGQEVS